jgi:signal transduction histidine kinase
MDIVSQEIAIIVVASLFFLLVAIGIVVLFLIYQKKQFQYMLEKKELSNRFQKELLETRLEAQEETLNNLGAELHDNIGQLLSSSKLLIGVADRELSAPSATLKVVDETMSKAIQQLRSISKSLSSDWLGQFDLIENLTTELERIKVSREVSVELHHSSPIDIAKERQVMLFRIVQEALQNALKHAKPTSITVKVAKNEESLYISVTDNGRGFNVNDVSKQGVGIMNIKHRAQLLGGSAQWQSSSNGTSVSIQLPIHANGNLG